VKLGHIELFVRDPSAAKGFYVDTLGFDLIEVQNDKFVWVSAGELSILLRPGRPTDAPDNYGDATTGLVLYTDDLDRAAAALRKRGLTFRGNDGSSRCLTFTDPDGHWFQLVDPKNH
jgi:catechol 2,3-dioxygenase-like lactoylglutathione lyase family enzyme